MVILEFIIEWLFWTVCGWVGHIVVKAATLGKVDLDWGSGAESILTEWLGFASLLVVGGLMAWILHR